MKTKKPPKPAKEKKAFAIANHVAKAKPAPPGMMNVVKGGDPVMPSFSGEKQEKKPDGAPVKQEKPSAGSPAPKHKKPKMHAPKHPAKLGKVGHKK